MKTKLITSKITIILIILFIFSFQPIQSSKQIKNIDKENLSVHRLESKSSSYYPISVGQELLLNYELDRNAYGIQLEKISANGTTTNLKSLARSNQEIQDKKLNFDLPNGCTAFKRDYSISLEHLFEGQEDDYIADLIVLPNTKQIYVLTKNFEVIRGYFSIVLVADGKNSIETSFEDDALSFKNTLISIYGSQTLEETEIFGFVPDDETYAYIITKYGSVRFNTQVEFGGTNFSFEQTNFDAKDNIYDVVYFENYVYVVLGSEGVNIYKIVKENFKLVTSLKDQLMKNAQKSGEESIEVTKVIFNSDLLAILDQQSGIYFYNVTDPTTPNKIPMEIQLNDIQSFDYRGNTMFIVFGGRQDKVWEIFIDYAKEQYYINRVYLDDITYRDVRMDRSYAVLLSDSVHRLISHSVYNGFASTSLWERHRYFDQIGLSFVVLLNYNQDNGSFYVQKRSYNVKNQLNIKQSNFLIAAGASQFTIHQVNELNTQIRCISQEAMQQQYQVTINSTSCDVSEGYTQGIGNSVQGQTSLEYNQNEINPFLQCQIVFNITLDVKEKLLSTKESNFYIAILFGILMFVAFVSCFLVMNYKSANRQREAMQQRWQDITYRYSQSDIGQDDDDEKNQNQFKNLDSQQEQQINSQENNNNNNQKKFQIDDDE
ncbi:hypothetical protein PPERSA_09212 [Pseudocohnilembus persalinus]|uniref:Transmembrane protein n=1 Tax=Pseudocohnilembus persalinus TaxID=266149 RepID=A0A0V0R4P8_PSEPJ|nr:hypothetical protein PPERSA_09212 [Pseudocohnilembus persalinus]|eukprot:KRX09328.1 hypothetical protein PPERSA_09212 [Pseudocohnilembus persalinus]